LRGDSIKRTNDCIHFTIDVDGNIGVLKSQNHKSLAFEIALAAHIAREFSVSGVCRSIDLNDQSM